MGRAKLDYDKMTDEEILELFKQQYNKIKPKDYVEFFRKSNNTPSAYILKSRLNLGWSEALVKIGIEIKRQPFSRKNNLDKQKCITIIKKLYKELGRTPTVFDLEKYTNISASNIKYKFGLNYNEILKECEIDCSNRESVQESNDELLKIYKDFCEKIGRIATSRDLDENNEMYNSGVYVSRFGGMNELRKLAGFDEYRKGYMIGKRKIMKLLKEVYIEKGSRISVKEINQNKDLPCQSTILHRFKTTKMTKVWEEIEHELIKDYINSLKSSSQK